MMHSQLHTCARMRAQLMLFTAARRCFSRNSRSWNSVWQQQWTREGGEVMGRGRRGDEWPFVCFVLFCLFSDERQEEERRTRTRTRTRSSSSNSRKRLAAHARTHTHTRTHTHIYARFPRDVLTNLDHGLAIIECPVHSNVVNICIQDGCHL